MGDGIKDFTEPNWLTKAPAEPPMCTGCGNRHSLASSCPASVEPQPDAPIQNSDVDAAQAWLNHAHGDSDQDCDKTDATCLTEAFATHRQRAFTRGREAAAKLLEEIGEKWIRNRTAAGIAEDIRALKDEPPALQEPAHVQTAEQPEHHFDPRSISQDCSCGWQALSSQRTTIIGAKRAWQLHIEALKPAAQPPEPREDGK